MSGGGGRFVENDRRGLDGSPQGASFFCESEEFSIAVDRSRDRSRESVSLLPSGFVGLQLNELIGEHGRLLKVDAPDEPTASASLRRRLVMTGVSDLRP